MKKKKIEVVKVEADDGTICWFSKEEEKLHREDGPAIIYPNGDMKWYLEGKLHREDGPAIVHDGNESWWFEDHLHRDDGPAIEYINGRKEWWKHGTRHREDGPAVILPDGYQAFWIEGELFSPEEIFN